MVDISIIVPVFQRKDIASQFFQSLRETLTPASNTQIIIIDDGSPLETSTFLRKETGRLKELGLTIELVSHDTNLGCGMSLNDGLHRVEGEAIVFADSDLILVPGWHNH
ncbi:glycosyltransferase family 2 protein [Trueperella pyogenes]|uniref:glycosyltransferase family 2 protein n=1 Tax=Trueperella pyogenes TaxID=1661 RepID=UPI00345D32C6